MSISSEPMPNVRGRISLLLLVGATAVIGALFWQPTIEAPLVSSTIQHHGGYQYSAPVPLSLWTGYRLPADSNDHPAESTLVLLRDGAPIGQPHVVHDRIKTEGNGAFSHWGEVLYFSAPGNSDPRSDGHGYAVRAQLVLASRARSALLFALSLSTLPLLWWVAAGVGRLGRHLWHARTAVAAKVGSENRTPLVRSRAALVALLAVECALVILFQRRPSVEWMLRPEAIAHQSGHAYTAALPELAPWGYELRSDSNQYPQQSTVTIWRDGQPLGPAHSVHESISKNGRGMFSHWQGFVYFSTPENTDPRGDGHVYHLRGYALPTQPVQVGMTGAAIAVALPLVYVAARRLRSVGGALVFPLKVAALSVVCVTAPWVWTSVTSREIERLASAGRWPFLGLYVALVAIAFAGLLVSPFIRNWRIRLPVVLVLLLGFAADQVFLRVSGQNLTLDLMQTLWRERAMAGTVLTAYSEAVIRSGVLVFVIAIPFLLQPRRGLRARFAGLPVVGLLAIAMVIFVTRGRTEAFPSPFAVPAQLAVAQLLSDSDSSIKRDPVEYARPLRPLFNKVIMVVDESVRGDYLALNNPDYDNTPTLSQAGDQLVNYGVAISAANCSVAARLILRVGLQKEQLPDTRGIWRRLPTIWQYAKKAGYETALVDAWRNVGDFHSYMDAQEAQQVDITRSTLSAPEYLRDSLLADAVVELLARDEPMFIYVNKNGTHQDYSHQISPQLTYDPTPLVASLPLDAARRETVKNYHKAIRWSVDHFFERLLPALQRDDTILIYTSDHGQSLFEGGYDLSHCSLTTALHLGEVRVPLFVIARSANAQASFRSAAARAFNRASHFEILPTLLHLMGYADSWIELMYGPDLLNVPIERRRGFLMGTFFDPAAVWIDAE